MKYRLIVAGYLASVALLILAGIAGHTHALAAWTLITAGASLMVASWLADVFGRDPYGR